MELSTINQYLGNLDIYLLDQVLKKRFHPKMKVLDAGCGEGRNLMYFLRSGYEVHGIDKNPMAISATQFIAASIRPDLSRDNFRMGFVEKMPYPEDAYDLIISSAVMHFAESEANFYQMFSELNRCAKPGGILFIRMASNIGIENVIKPLGAGRYQLPDGSERFLLTRSILHQLNEDYSLNYLEPFKTVNVNDLRCMSTLIVSLAG